MSLSRLCKAERVNIISVRYETATETFVKQNQNKAAIEITYLVVCDRYKLQFKIS